MAQREQLNKHLEKKLINNESEKMKMENTILIHLKHFIQKGGSMSMITQWTY